MRGSLFSLCIGAVCYFYGRDVYKSLGGKVPIGLLGSDWGGQPIEPFMSPDALNDKTCGGTKSTQHLNEQRDEQHDEQHDEHGEQHDEQHDEHGEQRVHLGDDSSIWNGMIAPLTKMRFASILWYQGESNAKAGLKYSCSFPAMVADWRLKFNSPKLPFYFVVLAPCDGSKWCDDFVNVRNAQFSALQVSGLQV
jgi:sialate O-acetylesterase